MIIYPIRHRRNPIIVSKPSQTKLKKEKKKKEEGKTLPITSNDDYSMKTNEDPEEKPCDDPKFQKSTGENPKIIRMEYGGNR